MQTSLLHKTGHFLRKSKYWLLVLTAMLSAIIMMHGRIVGLEIENEGWVWANNNYEMMVREQRMMIRNIHDGTCFEYNRHRLFQKINAQSKDAGEGLTGTDLEVIDHVLDRPMPQRSRSRPDQGR